jgi:isopenicillin-N N-acyltransferase-like protein
MSTDVFPELRIKGGGHVRGLTHGTQYRTRIERTLEFYLALFALPVAQLKKQSAYYRDVIGNFNDDYAAEIEGIAEGAKLEPWLIYALNSRSEILNNLGIPECTSAINTEAALLGQNWDWSEPLEDLVILLRIEGEDGHRVATLTEPGMLAKVGMNSAGLGVCLNILKSDSRLRGLPVHILLRAILDCRDMTQVRALVAANGPGKASHILVGDASGDYLSIEFAGETHYSLAAENGLLSHSNHYLASEELDTGEAFPSTRERYVRAREMLREDASRDGLWRMMLDQSEDQMSICRPYSPVDTAGFGNVGTVFSLLMDLKQGTMRIRPGCDPARGDYTLTV